MREPGRLIPGCRFVRLATRLRWPPESRLRASSTRYGGSRKMNRPGPARRPLRVPSARASGGRKNAPMRDAYSLRRRARLAAAGGRHRYAVGGVFVELVAQRADRDAEHIGRM